MQNFSQRGIHLRERRSAAHDNFHPTERLLRKRQINFGSNRCIETPVMHISHYANNLPIMNGFPVEAYMNTNELSQRILIWKIFMSKRLTDDHHTWSMRVILFIEVSAF